MCVFIVVFAAAAAAISARAFLPFFLDKKQNTPISCFFLCLLFFNHLEKKKVKKSLLYEQSLVQRRPVKRN